MFSLLFVETNVYDIGWYWSCVCNIWAHQPDPVTIEVFLLVGCPMCCPAIARCRSPCSPPLPDVQHTQCITIPHSQDSCSWILESPSWTTPTGSGTFWIFFSWRTMESISWPAQTEKGWNLPQSQHTPKLKGTARWCIPDQWNCGAADVGDPKAFGTLDKSVLSQSN